MKLIFVRHGEPDYTTDSLTEKGKIEAQLLSQRVKNFDVTQFYVSPMGRAQQTAAPTLSITGKEAITLPFLREFSYRCLDELTGREGVPWDYVPSDWTKYDCMFEPEDGFLSFPYIAKNPEVKENYPKVINGFDEILKEYGYIRDGKFYRNKNSKMRFLKSTVGPDNKIRDNGAYTDGEKEPTLVFFCHLGVTCLILSHLLNIPFELLTHGFYMPPTSLTILSSEERWGDESYFRVQAMGDCAHLLNNNHPISPAGYFASPFLK